jgi:hypothetical protein
VSIAVIAMRIPAISTRRDPHSCGASPVHGCRPGAHAFRASASP